LFISCVVFSTFLEGLLILYFIYVFLSTTIHAPLLVHLQTKLL
jgi:hypothetical protein